MKITPELLLEAVPSPPRRFAVDPTAHFKKWAMPLDRICKANEIVSIRRVACFLAQIGHESYSFARLAEVWGPTKGQRKYENRRDLGNVETGDGFRFRGRGLPQITGRYNYEQLSRARGVDYVDSPELLEEPDHATWAAGWWWSSRHLNLYADELRFKEMTRKWNGGMKGFPDRCVRLVRALGEIERIRA